MFSNPSKYGFGIQLNFLLQRHLAILRSLELGKFIIIERSHLDDQLFVDTLYAQSYISAEEYAAYRTVKQVLDSKIRDPHYYFYLDTPPEVSLERLKTSEITGERPIEFPDDNVKEAFVRSWYTRYQEFYGSLLNLKSQGKCFAETTFLALDERLTLEDKVTTCCEVLGV